MQAIYASVRVSQKKSQCEQFSQLIFGQALLSVLCNSEGMTDQRGTDDPCDGGPCCGCDGQEREGWRE